MVFLQYYLYYVLSISSRGLFLMMMMMMSLVFAGPTGLTLKLIHRDSPESPLYPGNLTQLERTERAFQRLKDREQKLSTYRMKQVISSSRNINSTTNSKSSDDLDALRPWVRNYDRNSYMVELGLGTFANIPGHQPPTLPFYYHFYFDTGSNLLWIQCDPMTTHTDIHQTRYFCQDQPLYRGDLSHTFNLLPANDPDTICRKYDRSEGIFCGYSAIYGDAASSAGALATDKITVNNGRLEEIENFVFGCGLRQNEPDFGQNDPGQNPIVGMLGFGGGEESFIRQLGDQAQNKFEYCLKPWNDNTPVDTFLRFGSDAKIPRAVARGQRVQTTRILPIRGDTLYYVIMYGISIDGEQVVYPDDSVFQAISDGSGGCIFDTGAEVTQFSSQVYDPFEQHLIRYFATRHGIGRRIPSRSSPFDLCFQKLDGFSLYPGITFHFRGVNIGDEIVNFEIKPRTLFSIGRNIFCLTIRRTNLRPSFSVIVGALQQANHRILHDLGAGTISWANDLCAANP